MSPRSCAITATPVALALQFHVIAHAHDAGDSGSDLLRTIQRVRRPDVATQQRHSVVDAHFDIAEVEDGIGLQCGVDALSSGCISAILFGGLWGSTRAGR